MEDMGNQQIAMSFHNYSTFNSTYLIYNKIFIQTEFLQQFCISLLGCKQLFILAIHCFEKQNVYLSIFFLTLLEEQKNSYFDNNFISHQSSYFQNQIQYLLQKSVQHLLQLIGHQEIILIRILKICFKFSYLRWHKKNQGLKVNLIESENTLYIIFFMIVILSTLLTSIIIGQSHCQSINSGTQFEPIEALSISIDDVFLTNNLKNNKATIFQNLSSIPKVLQLCQVVGSISQINLHGSPQLQFYFKYKLEKKNSTLIVDIFAKNDDLQPFSSDLLIVLDFLVATFPIDYSVMQFKMTSYQQHIAYHTNNTYQLIFFLNGFNKAGMSGNVTHSYQSSADLYTIHYMTCDTESNQMGWKKQDYIYFTVLVVPMKNLVQKFKINDTIYKLDFKDKSKYFYGIKGTTDPEFVGSFHQRYGGVNFNVQNLALNKTYGIIFLPYPETKFLDNRLHVSPSIIRVAALISCASLLLIVLIGILIKKKCGYKLSQILTTDREFNQEQQSKQSTKSQLRTEAQGKIGRQQRRMSTVPEVEEGLEGSLKGSYNPKIDKLPSLVLND